MQRLLAVIPTLFLFSSIFNLDITHYEKMHYVVPACALYLMYDSFKKEQRVFYVAFFISIVLFNPVFPARWYMDGGWIIPEFFFSIVFMVKILI